MNTPAPKPPLVPDDLNPARAIVRAAWSCLVAAIRSGSPAECCQRLYPRDVVALGLLTRASTTTGTTTVSGWASQLVDRALAAWLASLAPDSAAATLISEGLVLPISGVGGVNIPGRATGPTAIGWVGEGLAIPARAFSLTQAQLTPKKVAALVVWSRELSRLTDADRIFEALLREDAALGLDGAWFGTQASSTAAHPGLLAGLTPIAGTAQMSIDLAALAHAVGAGSSGQVVYVAGPGRAAAAAVKMPAEATARILPSLAVPETRLIAVDPAALVSGFSSDPEFTASNDATIHLSDTPADFIGAVGTPPVVAAPLTNLFQTAAASVRVIMDIAFATRRTGAVAYIDAGMTW